MNIEYDNNFDHRGSTYECDMFCYDDIILINEFQKLWRGVAKSVGHVFIRWSYRSRNGTLVVFAKYKLSN